MTRRLADLADHLRASFWFVPAVMAVAAAALADATVALDRRLDAAAVRDLGWVYTGGPAGAGSILATLAGSMVTLAGLVFSLVVVTLTLASQQFGPRLIPAFLTDRVNQAVLGTFVSCFLYSLLVARTVREQAAGVPEFVPHVSVTVAVGLAVAALGVLVFFIHHVAHAIQADRVIARVGGDLEAAIDREYPDRPAADPGFALPDDFAGTARAVPAPAAGYVRAIDLDRLVGLGAEHDLVVVVDRRPGRFVLPGTPVARAWPADRATPEVARGVAAAFALGPVRTAAQDVEFAAHQLVEVAVRALSPGVNDPFTAAACVDRLAAAVARVGGRAAPPAAHRDPAGAVRVVLPPVTFPDLLDAAFHQIRQYGRSSAAVLIRVLEGLTEVARGPLGPADRAAVRRHAAMVVRAGRGGLAEENDRADLDARFAALAAVLGPNPPPDPEAPRDEPAA